jgi:hypothetical protein
MNSALRNLASNLKYAQVPVAFYVCEKRNANPKMVGRGTRCAPSKCTRKASFAEVKLGALGLPLPSRQFLKQKIISKTAEWLNL